MRKFRQGFLLALLMIASGVSLCCANDTNYAPGRIVVQSTYGSSLSCSTATADGSVCAEQDLEAEDDLDIGDDATISGAATVGETLGITGDLTCSGGAGALTFSGSTSSIVVDDNDTTALLIGSTGQLNLVTLDTGDNTETVVITGTTTTDSLHVDVGDVQLDEDLEVDGDIDVDGGAGCLDVSSSGDSTLIAADADSTAFCMGATGALDLVCIDTTDASPALDVKGVVGQVGFHLDAGTAQIDETLTVTGDISPNGGAGCLTVSGSGDSTLVAADADSTAFCMGAAGALDLVCLDTTDASPALDVKGVVGQVGFHLDAGTAQIDETLTVTGDISPNGGAGCLTVSGSGDSTLVAADADATAFCMGAAGALDLVCLDTTDASPAWDVKGVSGQVALHVDVGTVLVDEDISCGGGAGAVTLTHSDSSMVLIDNDASALDIGAAGETDMVRFTTTDGAEFVEFRVHSVMTGIYETFGEGANKGSAFLQIDGTAEDGTAGTVNHAYVGGGNILGYTAIGDNAADGLDMTATGLNIANDQADNEGREIWTGYAGASGRPMIVGTDPAFYFLTGINIGDIDGTDTVFCGFKKLEAHNADYTAYDTYAGIGANTSADPMVLKVIEELNGADAAQTDTTDTLQDATTLQIKVLVSGAGVTTFQIDPDTPGTLEAPDTTSAFTFDDGDALVPICTYLEHNAGGLADTFDVTHWEVGYQ